MQIRARASAAGVCLAEQDAEKHSRTARVIFGSILFSAEMGVTHVMAALDSSVNR